MRKVVATLVVGIAMSVPATSKAIIPVEDPINLIENASTAISTASDVVQQIRTVRKQMKMLKQMKKDLEQLEAGDLQELQRSFYRLQSLYQRGQMISMQWQRVANQYNQKYEGYQKGSGREAYKQKRKKWEKQTDESIKSAMKAQGVTSSYDDRRDLVDKIVEKSSGAEGTLAAIQAGNRIAAVLAEQMMELTEIIAADSRAKLSYIKEQQEKQQAERKRSEESFDESWGEMDGRERPPSQMPEVK